MAADRYAGWTPEQLRLEYEKSVRQSERLFRLGLVINILAAVFCVVALVAKIFGH